MIQQKWNQKLFKTNKVLRYKCKYSEQKNVSDVRFHTNMSCVCVFKLRRVRICLKIKISI